MRGRNWGAYLEVAHGAVEANQLGRLEQFAAIQYKFAGDPKHALEIFKRQLRDTDTKGARGFMFGAQRQISDMLIRMGDLAQAEAYLRRNLSLRRREQVVYPAGEVLMPWCWFNLYGRSSPGWIADAFKSFDPHVSKSAIACSRLPA